MTVAGRWRRRDQALRRLRRTMPLSSILLDPEDRFGHALIRAAAGIHAEPSIVAMNLLLRRIANGGRR